MRELTIDAKTPLRMASLGDSFTEGVGDEYADGTARGWADRVAQGLADAHGTEVRFANLAIRGLLLEQIVTTQVEAALALDPAPTLVTFNGGGNDMLRPRMDAERMMGLITEALDAFSTAGIRVVALAGPDPTGGLPLGQAIRRRGAELTDAMTALTAARGVDFIDIFHDSEIQRPQYWAEDRLHMGPDGHRRVADLVLRAFGRVETPHALPAGEPPRKSVSDQLRYGRSHLLPWVGRRLRGRSSADGRIAKHQQWATLTPQR